MSGNNKKNRIPGIDIVKTNRWVKSVGIKVDTEGLILAAQPRRNYQANIL